MFYRVDGPAICTLLFLSPVCICGKNTMARQDWGTIVVHALMMISFVNLSFIVLLVHLYCHRLRVRLFTYLVFPFLSWSYIYFLSSASRSIGGIPVITWCPKVDTVLYAATTLISTFLSSRFVNRFSGDIL